MEIVKFPHSFRLLAILCFALLAANIANATPSPTYPYALTSGTYAATDNLTTDCQAEFGSGAQVADWNDIKAQYGGSVAAIANFCDSIGLAVSNSSTFTDAWVVNGTSAFFSGTTRHFLVERHNGTPVTSFLVHDTIQSNYLDLGSWINPNRILVRIGLLIKATASVGGTTSGAGAYLSGSTVTLVATPSAGYAFLNWTESGTTVCTSASYAFTAAASRNLTANFTSFPYALTSGTYAATDNLTADCQAEFGSGAQVADWNDIKAQYGGSVAAIANFCNSIGLAVSNTSSFTDAWVVNGTSAFFSGTTRHFLVERHNGTPVTSFLVHDTIQSNYLDLGSWINPNKILVRLGSLIKATASVGGTTSGAGAYLSGSTVTLVATPSAGYAFLNWTESGTTVCTSATYAFTMAASRNLTANFTAFPYALTSGTYAATDNLTTDCQAEFGSGAQVADWNDIKAQYGGSVAAIANFCNSIGLAVSNTSTYTDAWVVNGTSAFYSGTTRHFLVERHNGTPVTSFLVHDTIQSNYLDLGSWINPNRILVRLGSLIKVTASAGGYAGGAGAYLSGSTVTLVATPSAGYAFAKWTESGTTVCTSASYAFPVAASRTLTANFTAIPSPTVSAVTVSDTTETTASISALVTPNGSTTDVTVDYGLASGSYLYRSETVLVAGTATQNIEVPIAALAPHHTYFFTVAVHNAGGQASAAEGQFKTLPRFDVDANGSSDLLVKAKNGKLVAILLAKGKQHLRLPIPVSLGGKTLIGMPESSEGTLEAVTVDKKNVVWFLGLNPSTLSGTAIVRGPAVTAGWQVAGVADFNGDGSQDLLIVNTKTGATAIWLLNGASVVQKIRGPKLPLGFSVVAIDDFNGDAKPDVLIWNATTGAVKFVTLKGTVGSIAAGPAIPPGWQLCGGNDYLGTGSPQLLLVNPKNGATRLWALNGFKKGKVTTGPTLSKGDMIVNTH